MKNKLRLRGGITLYNLSNKNDGWESDNFFDDFNQLKPYRLEQVLLDATDLIFTKELGFMYFEKIWKPVSDYVIKQDIKNLLADRYRSAYADEMIKQLSVECYIDFERINYNRDCLVLENGTLDLSDWKNPIFCEDEYFEEDYCTVELACSYDNNANCPRFMEFLNDIFNNDQELINLVGEMFGYCLTASTKFESSFILYGQGANGKSTLINVLKELITPANLVALNINQLNSDFNRAALMNKLACISTEFDGKISNSGIFKQIVSGESISASYKYKDVFTFTPYAKLVFALNALPKVFDTSNGYYRRLIMIPFDNSYEGENKDIDLTDKLLLELDGILQFAIAGLQRLGQKGKFTVSLRAEGLKQAYRLENDPIGYILDQLVEEAVDGTVGSRELYTAYQEYCMENGFKGVMNSQNFGKQLRRLFTKIDAHRTTIDGHKETIYCGIRLQGKAEDAVRNFRLVG